jgi:hypothetical protein
MSQRGPQIAQDSKRCTPQSVLDSRWPAEGLCAARLVTQRAARTIMLVCSLFARLPRYGPAAPGTIRHRDSARLGPGVHEPAARDSLRYRLIPRRVGKIGLLIRGAIAAGQGSRHGTYDSAQARRTSKLRLPDLGHRHAGPQPVYDRYMKGPSEVDGRLIRRERRLAFSHAEPDNSAVRIAVARSTMDHVTHLARPLSASEPALGRPIPSTFQAPQPIGDATLTVRGSAPTQHAIGN